MNAVRWISDQYVFSILSVRTRCRAGDCTPTCLLMPVREYYLSRNIRIRDYDCRGGRAVNSGAVGLLIHYYCAGTTMTAEAEVRNVLQKN